MKIKPEVCSHCGAELKIYGYGKFAVCPCCRSKFELKVTHEENSSLNKEDFPERRECPVCRGYGTMIPNLKGTKWKCTDCGYSYKDEYLESTFWFCDSCDTFLNVQPGFNEKGKTWKCAQCGFVNDITEDNIF